MGLHFNPNFYLGIAIVFSWIHGHLALLWYNYNVNNTTEYFQDAPENKTNILVASGLFRVTAAQFEEAFVSAEPRLAYQGFLADIHEHDLSNADCFLTASGGAGFIVADGWIGSVFAVSEEKGFVRRYGKIMRRLEDRLQCIVTERYGDALVRLYAEALDFKVVAVTVDDAELLKSFYGKEDPRALMGHGRIRHFFMVRKEFAAGRGIRTFSDWKSTYDWVDGLSRNL